MATNGNEGGLKMIEELTTNAEQIQDEELGEILSRNAGTEYLRGFLHGQTEKQLFKKNVPIVTYEDLKPYIDRIANGETSDILLAEPVTGFFLSSGTSGGQPKLIPVSAEYHKKGALVGTFAQSPMMRYEPISISCFQLFIQLHVKSNLLLIDQLRIKIPCLDLPLTINCGLLLRLNKKIEVNYVVTHLTIKSSKKNC
ncbi:indole-3-acetic acid-amido synthetase GH3.15 isoform X1 [Gossypium hirsutum]|uniref:Indole-3-acetic acid-amido synthetase GH3.15 isoform X1 n=1 Tax=Gossypium hirsutum TaxID=3635 RepID=A0ABM2ZZG3_GOSHI|nr:indole-3-acetic acid-amido synthetase GH3.15 isoform X1 [Gossypium hirsutum]